MHFAVFNHVMLEPLRAMGFPIDDVDPKFGVTPLMIAAWAGWLEPQVWLLQHGADPTRRDRKGKSARDYSRMGRAWFDSMVKRYGKK